MNFDQVKEGIYVIVNKPSSKYHGQEGTVLSTHHELTGAEFIRLCIEESGDVVPGFKASDLSA